MRIYNHEYCMSCKQENPQDREICECGGRNFIFGDHIELVDGRFQCTCGSDKFTFASHVNMNPIHNTTYKCAECKNIVGKQIYHSSYDDGEEY